MGARSALPGFRINGYESPFRAQSEAPYKQSSVHREHGNGLLLVYGDLSKRKALTGVDNANGLLFFRYYMHVLNERGSN